VSLCHQAQTALVLWTTNLTVMRFVFVLSQSQIQQPSPKAAAASPLLWMHSSLGTASAMHAKASHPWRRTVRTQWWPTLRPTLLHHAEDCWRKDVGSFWTKERRMWRAACYRYSVTQFCRFWRLPAQSMWSTSPDCHVALWCPTEVSCRLRPKRSSWKL
jgi:hypothetical protein